MPLPIVIFCERHWDDDAQRAIQAALSRLKACGYDTLCDEQPTSAHHTFIIERVKHSIDVITDLLNTSQAWLQKRDIHKTPTELALMGFTELDALLHQWVSSQRHSAFAKMFKELPAIKQKLITIQNALDLGFDIRGVDLEEEKSQGLNSGDTPFDCSLRAEIIRKTESLRIESFVSGLLALQNQGKGVIFMTGQSHYEELVKAFASQHYLNEVLFVHAHSHRKFDPNLNDNLDRILPTIDDLISEPQLLDHRIVTHADIDSFVIQLEKKLEDIFENFYRQVESHTAITLLSDNFQVMFSAYQRPSGYVDLMYPVKNDNNLGQMQATLSRRGIHCYTNFFKQKPHLCIPRVNEPEVANKLWVINTR